MSFLSQIKEGIRIGKAKFKLSKTPVTETNMIAFGFEKQANHYIMGDLIIYRVGTLFYYQNLEGRLTEIKNAQEVSLLVFGKIKYLKSWLATNN